LSSFLPVTPDLPSLLSLSVKAWSAPECSNQAAVKWSKGVEGKKGRHAIDEGERHVFSEISQLAFPPT